MSDLSCGCLVEDGPFTIAVAALRAAQGGQGGQGGAARSAVAGRRWPPRSRRAIVVHGERRDAGDAPDGHGAVDLEGTRTAS